MTLNPPSLVSPDTVIAIDGPAGSGKSTTARALAERLGLLYVDTGAMYRALTWAATRQAVDISDADALSDLLRGAEIDLDSHNRETVVYWNHSDISRDIRSPEIEAKVSEVSAHPAVRRQMVHLQRHLSRRQGVVMEGRDIGSVVFPIADAKIFLDASLEARAQRRLRQYQRQGRVVDEASLRADMAERDRLDSGRQNSPLVIAPDAIVIDNSDMGLPEQLDITTEAVLQIIEQKQPETPSPESPSGHLTPRYRFAYAAFAALGDFMGLKVYGRRWADMEQGTIIAPNHVSNWDPPILAASLRSIGQCRAIAKEELFRNPIMRQVYRFLNTVPIKRSIYDKTAFDLAAHYLAMGENIVFFPEGMRRVYGRPGPVRNGLGMLMQRTGAPAVPFYFRGTMAPQPGGSTRSPLEAHFAPPVRLHALPTMRERMNERDINASVARLFESIYQELQDRSTARIPFSDWELEQSALGVARVESREAKTFKRRPRK